jgi:hypothetical protein
MKRKVKLVLLALSTGLIALNSGACLFRFLGDLLGDQIWLGRIN